MFSEDEKQLSSGGNRHGMEKTLYLWERMAAPRQELEAAGTWKAVHKKRDESRIG